MTLTKPTSRAEIIPAYRVGEDGWLQTVRAVLEAYGVPTPPPPREEDIRQAEARIACALPRDWRALLLELGAVDLEAYRFLPPSQIQVADSVWFREHLSDAERADLPHMLSVAETGSDNVFVYDMRSGLVRLASHDPGGLFEAIPGVGDLLRWALVGLAAGYYGWPDAEVADLVDRTQREMLNEWADQERAG
jgi:hypothetical protein